MSTDSRNALFNTDSIKHADLIAHQQSSAVVFKQAQTTLQNSLNSESVPLWKKAMHQFSLAANKATTDGDARNIRNYVTDKLSTLGVFTTLEPKHLEEMKGKQDTFDNAIRSVSPHIIETYAFHPKPKPASNTAATPKLKLEHK